MNKLLLFLFLPLLYSSHVIYDPPNLSDGPYIFYRKGKIISKCIIVKQGVQSICVDTLEVTSNFIKINYYSNGLNNSFSARLKKKMLKPESIYKQMPKTLIVSDIEGEFESFLTFLIGNNVINKNLEWTFGNGNLVIAGDLFDRGKQVSQLLWFLYKLEDEAARGGGRLNIILGNHDIMNLAGEYKYVNPIYFNNAKILSEEYSSLYAVNTEIGKWLRSKNIIEKIGDMLITHGGISTQVMRLNKKIGELNDLCRPLFDYGKDKKYISEHGATDLFNQNSPFWFRGYFVAPRLEISQIDSALKIFNCTLIVVGHTIIRNNISLYYENKVLGVDVDVHNEDMRGALILKKKIFSVDKEGKRIKIFYKPENDRIKASDLL